MSCSLQRAAGALATRSTRATSGPAASHRPSIPIADSPALQVNVGRSARLPHDDACPAPWSVALDLPGCCLDAPRDAPEVMPVTASVPSAHAGDRCSDGLRVPASPAAIAIAEQLA